MTNASTLENMSPELLRVVERAQQEPEGRFPSLAHLMDVPVLERAHPSGYREAARLADFYGPNDAKLIFAKTPDGSGTKLR